VTSRRPPWGLRCLLAGAVIAPAVAAVGAALYSVRMTDDWYHATDAPGPALCGLFGIVPIAVLVIWAAIRGLARPDGEIHVTIAAGCALGVVCATISLADAATVLLGHREGRVPTGMLIAVAVAWVYFLAVGLGHWWLSRVDAPDHTKP
jgi:hypothetical protein